MLITLDQLRSICRSAHASDLAAYLPHLNAAMAERQINTPLRAAAFLAQLAHESGEFRYMEELGSGAEYEGRRDLGNTQPGDGKRYKGRGPIQLTGRANYRDYGKALGLDLEAHPEQASRPEVGFRVAAAFWQRKGCNPLADAQDFRRITEIINGGLRGLESRLEYYHRALAVMPAADPGAVTIIISGEPLATPGFLDGDTSYAPLREACEALGCSVGPVDTNSVEVRSHIHLWDVATQQRGDKRYARARDLARVSGRPAPIWDPHSRTVTL